jgi:hypothetical protein
MPAPRGGLLPSAMFGEHVLQSKYFRLATVAPWNISNRQIHENLGVPLFDDQIRALTANFDSKLGDVWNPRSTTTLKILTLTEG